MRLAVLTNDFPPKPGGIQQYLGSLVDAYPDDVLVIAPGDDSAEYESADHVTVRRETSGYLWPTRRLQDRMAGAIEDFDADVVLIGAPTPLGRMAEGLKRRLDRPVGILSHGAEVTIPAAGPGARQTIRRWLAAADVRFGVSRYTCTTVERLTGRPAVYIGGGVDIERFVPTEATERDVPLVGCVSRFVPRKGQARLIDAVAKLRAEGTACDLMLVGTGRTEDTLRRHAAAKGVPVRFEVGVPWSRLPDLYADLDIFCMPCRSRWLGLEVEGLGLVFLEAAAAGIPVVAGTSGGSPETVDPGVTGYVVDDVDGIVDALRPLLVDPARRRKMGDAGRRRIEAEFTWSAVADRLVAGFDAVV